MLDEVFAESWVNSTHRVLGLKLRPFSLWSRFQLAVLRSPMLEGKEVSPVDLYRAVHACRLRYPKTVTGKLNMWALRWRLAGHDYRIEIQKFDNYIRDFYSPPKVLPSVKKVHNTDPSHPPPEDMQIFSAVATMTGWSEATIWDMPIGQAYWYAAGHWYQAGQSLDFMTPEHEILRQKIEEQKAKIAADIANGVIPPIPITPAPRPRRPLPPEIARHLARMNHHG